MEGSDLKGTWIVGQTESEKHGKEGSKCSEIRRFVLRRALANSRGWKIIGMIVARCLFVSDNNALRCNSDVQVLQFKLLADCNYSLRRFRNKRWCGCGISIKSRFCLGKPLAICNYDFWVQGCSWPSEGGGGLQILCWDSRCPQSVFDQTSRGGAMFELPIKGMAIMKKGKNLCYFRREEQCIALRKQLRNMKIQCVKIYLVARNGKVLP